MHHTPGMSPVAYADCKLVTCGEGPMCVDVRFSSVDEIDEFIQCLALLRDSADLDHAHLQDRELLHGPSAARTEIVFHLPGSCFDPTRDGMIAEAEERLTRGKAGRLSAGDADRRAAPGNDAEASG